MLYNPYEEEKKPIWKVITIIMLMIGIVAAIIMAAYHIKEEEKLKEEEYEQVQENIADEIIRFHVIANSDLEADQELKLCIKDRVVEYLRGQLQEAKTKQEAEVIIKDNLDKLEQIAMQVIEEYGYTYGAKASLTECEFPIKQYGDMVFPAGEYEALRIQLGKSEGKNWWCVMFPTLCYVKEATQEITEENKEQFQEILTKEEYESLLIDMKEQETLSMESEEGEEKVFYHLKIQEWANKVIDYFKE